MVGIIGICMCKIVNKYCSVNTEEDNFFPVKFYDYDTEKWFGKDDEEAILFLIPLTKGRTELEVTPLDEAMKFNKEIDRPY